jgi:hypothetical protein
VFEAGMDSVIHSSSAWSWKGVAFDFALMAEVQALALFLSHIVRQCSRSRQQGYHEQHGTALHKIINYFEVNLCTIKCTHFEFTVYEQ